MEIRYANEINKASRSKAAQFYVARAARLACHPAAAALIKIEGGPSVAKGDDQLVSYGEHARSRFHWGNESGDTTGKLNILELSRDHENGLT